MYIKIMCVCVCVFLSFFLSFFLPFFTRGFALVNDAHISHSQDIRFRARISNTRGDHFGQHKNKSNHPKDIRFRARISNTRSDHTGQPN